MAPARRSIVSRLKPYLRWLILGGTLFFVTTALKRHWDEVTALRIEPDGWVMLAIALGVTLLAHVWSGWVWGWILGEFNQPAPGAVPPGWSVRVYLKTNIAKYLPGNVWHFYGRIVAAKQAGVPIAIATLSVVLEPLLMAAAAVTLALFGATQYWFLQLLVLIAVLISIHPKILNPLLQLATRLKKPPSSLPTPDSPPPTPHLTHYPLRPFLGELLFVLLRGIGFLFTLLAVSSIAPQQLLVILSSFSVAWVLGLVIPGAPGGIGVFEATAIALLSPHLPTAVILGGVALYRLVSTLAEVTGAGLAWVAERGSGVRD